MPPAISIRGLARAFAGRTVLRDVSLTVPAGAVCCIVGANGSGKTTLLEVLATLLTATAGTVHVLGHDVSREAAEVRRLVGYGISSLHSFYPQLTARRNLEFFAAVHGLGRREAQRRVETLLAAVGLAESAGVQVQKFSDGMKARLSTARALVADPPVLLLDEPTRGLDEAARATVRRLATAPAAGGAPRTVVWTTHDRAEALALGDEVHLLEQGVLRRIAVRGAENLERAVSA